MKKALAVLTALALMMCAGALAEGTLTTRGVGVVLVDADHASISMGVRENAPDVMTAQSVVNEKVEAMVAALTAMGVRDDAITTGSIGIYPNYSYDDDGDECIGGYCAYNDLVIQLSDVDSVGAVIDAAFAAGANSLDYVEYSAADTGEAADQALALAVESATHKAEALAAAAGMQLGEIRQIVEGGDNGYVYDDGLAARSEDAGAGTQVRSSKQKVQAVVTITFAID